MSEDKNTNETWSEKYNREKREKEELQKKLEAEYFEDMNTNPRYKEFFARFNDSSVKYFIRSFAQEKARLAIYGHLYLDEEEDYMTKYYDKAEELIWEIQQRKLFDLQIKWRAEQVKIPEIDICYEFDYWEQNIRSCPFITPIAQDEFDLYMEYLRYTPYDEIFSDSFFGVSYQDYDNFKKYYYYLDKQEEYYEEPPAWYEFYESRTGSSILYMLPDIRGTKEDFYLDLYRENQNKKEEEENKGKPKAELKHDDREAISTDLEFMKEFVKKFEDDETYKKFLSYKSHRESEDDNLTEAIRTLQYADRIFPIGNNINWKEAIIEAAYNFEKEKLIEEMPKVYVDYLFRLQTGITFENNETSLRDKYLDEYVTFNKQKILEGRKLNGEPEDFDF